MKEYTITKSDEGRRMDKFAMAGGVASNQTLRAALKEAVEGEGASP